VDDGTQGIGITVRRIERERLVDVLQGLFAPPET
jgi:hypothetical protein